MHSIHFFMFVFFFILKNTIECLESCFFYLWCFCEVVPECFDRPSLFELPLWKSLKILQNIFLPQNKERQKSLDQHVVVNNDRNFSFE